MGDVVPNDFEAAVFGTHEVFLLVGEQAKVHSLRIARKDTIREAIWVLFDETLNNFVGDECAERPNERNVEKLVVRHVFNSGKASFLVPVVDNLQRS